MPLSTYVTRAIAVTDCSERLLDLCARDGDHAMAFTNGTPSLPRGQKDPIQFSSVVLAYHRLNSIFNHYRKVTFSPSIPRTKPQTSKSTSMSSNMKRNNFRRRQMQKSGYVGSLSPTAQVSKVLADISKLSNS